MLLDCVQLGEEWIVQHQNHHYSPYAQLYHYLWPSFGLGSVSAGWSVLRFVYSPQGKKKSNSLPIPLWSLLFFIFYFLINPIYHAEIIIYVTHAIGWVGLGVGQCTSSYCPTVAGTLAIGALAVDWMVGHEVWSTTTPSRANITFDMHFHSLTPHWYLQMCAWVFWCNWCSPLACAWGPGTSNGLIPAGHSFRKDHAEVKWFGWVDIIILLAIKNSNWQWAADAPGILFSIFNQLIITHPNTFFFNTVYSEVFPLPFASSGVQSLASLWHLWVAVLEILFLQHIVEFLGHPTPLFLMVYS